MVTVNYELIPEQFFINYFNFLISKLFKILPISESEPETLKSYLESLLIEITGSQIVISKIKCDANFISLLSTLQYLIDNECSHKTYKREVFKCINIVKSLQEKYK